MSRTQLSFLRSSAPPWIYVGQGEPDRIGWVPAYFYADPDSDVCVRRLRGWKMRDVASLMSEFGAALQFFDGFGENWHALEDCLRNLDEWLPAQAYVIVIERAEDVLVEDDENLTALLNTLHSVGDSWSQAVDTPEWFSRPARPFHVLFNVSETPREGVARIIRAAAAANVPVRTDQ